MVSRGIKEIAPLRSALPDVFLRKNTFEERMLRNKQKILEKAEKKVIERLAREQEEFAILNCVHFGNDSGKFGNGLENRGDRSKNFENGSSNRENDLVSFKKGSRRFESLPQAESNDLARNDLNQHTDKTQQIHERRLWRSKSTSFCSIGNRMSRENFEKFITAKTQANSRTSEGQIEDGNKTELRKPILRPSLSVPDGSEMKRVQRESGGNRRRATSAPVRRTEVSFSGKDGRKMSLTPVVRQFSNMSETLYSNSGPKSSSLQTLSAKTLRDLPKTAQVQFKSNVYFLSEHKIKQRTEMAKIRTKRAMSAQAFRKNSI